MEGPARRTERDIPKMELLPPQPVLMPPLSSTSRAMKIGLISTRLDQMKLSELVRWTIRPRLMAVPGVANVAVWGQRDRQLQVLVDPDRLRASGVGNPTALSVLCNKHCTSSQQNSFFVQLATNTYRPLCLLS